MVGGLPSKLVLHLDTAGTVAISMVSTITKSDSERKL